MIGRPERDSGCAFIAVFKRLQSTPLEKGNLSTFGALQTPCNQPFLIIGNDI